MTTQPDPPAVRLCTGTLPGEHIPGADKPQALACAFCPDSGRYWADSPEVQRRRAAAGQG